MAVYVPDTVTNLTRSMTLHSTTPGPPAVCSMTAPIMSDGCSPIGSHGRHGGHHLVDLPERFNNDDSDNSSGTIHNSSPVSIVGDSYSTSSSSTMTSGKQTRDKFCEDSAKQFLARIERVENLYKEMNMNISEKIKDAEFRKNNYNSEKEDKEMIEAIASLMIPRQRYITSGEQPTILSAAPPSNSVTTQTDTENPLEEQPRPLLGINPDPRVESLIVQVKSLITPVKDSITSMQTHSQQTRPDHAKKFFQIPLSQTQDHQKRSPSLEFDLLNSRRITPSLEDDTISIYSQDSNVMEEIPPLLSLRLPHQQMEDLVKYIPRKSFVSSQVSSETSPVSVQTDSQTVVPEQPRLQLRDSVLRSNPPQIPPHQPRPHPLCRRKHTYYPNLEPQPSNGHFTGKESEESPSRNMKIQGVTLQIQPQQSTMKLPENSSVESVALEKPANDCPSQKSVMKPTVLVIQSHDATKQSNCITTQFATLGKQPNGLLMQDKDISMQTPVINNNFQVPQVQSSAQIQSKIIKIKPQSLHIKNRTKIAEVHSGIANLPSQDFNVQLKMNQQHIVSQQPPNNGDQCVIKLKKVLQSPPNLQTPVCGQEVLYTHGSHHCRVTTQAALHQSISTQQIARHQKEIIQLKSQNISCSQNKILIQNQRVEVQKQDALQHPTSSSEKHLNSRHEDQSVIRQNHTANQLKQGHKSLQRIIAPQQNISHNSKSLVYRQIPYYEKPIVPQNPPKLNDRSIGDILPYRPIEQIHLDQRLLTSSQQPNLMEQPRLTPIQKQVDISQIHPIPVQHKLVSCKNQYTFNSQSPNLEQGVALEKLVLINGQSSASGQVVCNTGCNTGCNTSHIMTPHNNTRVLGATSSNGTVLVPLSQYLIL